MEEYDDLSAGPTNDGSLNLNHNTWKTLPSELINFSTKLIHLHMSNNQLTSIPESIGALTLLRTLDVSLNRIESIDAAIGKCIRLRRFDFSKNRVEYLPAEIGNCVLIEEFIACDNLLSYIPQEMLQMFVISVIDVRNNKLTALPTGLCRLPTITKLLCAGNPCLTSVPEKMRGDTDLVLHCLDMQLTFTDVISPMEAEHCELQARSNELGCDLTQARAHLKDLEKEVASLKWERPDEYLQFKSDFLSFIRRVWERLVAMALIMKRASRKLLTKIMDRLDYGATTTKTHPMY